MAKESGSDGRFTLIAHRGFSSDAPENTYDAFDMAIENGFNNIETDVQLTSDGVPVIIHDAMLDRTTSGKGPVAEATIAYVKSLDAGVWFEAPADGVGRHGPASYGDSFVPTLEEFLQRYKDNVNLHPGRSQSRLMIPEFQSVRLTHLSSGGRRTRCHISITGSCFDASPHWIVSLLPALDVPASTPLPRP
jgi:glycerophosphoryl diester phosphodiesterase